MDLSSVSQGCGCDGCQRGRACCEAGALPYRAYTHGEFLDRMRTRLREELPEATFSSRAANEVDDIALGLLDAWATMADVLSFYQERFLAEGYLETASEERSVRELASMIGHQPRPPSSATVSLVMTVEESPEVGAEVPVKAGTQVQSAPVEDEEPQVFETTRTVTLRPAWNELRPRRMRPPPALGVGRLETARRLVLSNDRASVVEELFLEPGPSVPMAGDLLVFVEASRPSGLSPYELHSVAVRIKTVKTQENGVRHVVLDSLEFAEQTG